MNTIGAIVVWCVFGLIVGFVARALYPGRQPMGVGMTMVLGIVGSLVGGFIAWAVNGGPERGVFDGSGWFMSIVGALIVVWAGLAFGKPNRAHPL
ncbi:MAG TPA: GlsB/YeaQ/YmgE family stress response membrane protein [Planctomycetaceae bacterium]|nr:GlsB/YeaQ/YmgE family stress response membrane protein [Planctomycetaceae bacterium]